MRVKGWLSLAVPLLACVLGSACQRSSEPPPAGVVFVLVDALRADRLGCYGNARNTSPNIDALAKDGTLFRNTIAPAPWTLPSMATIWTSLYPSIHGATRMSALMKKGFRPVSVLEDSRVTLAEVLQRNGFDTAAFVDGSYCRKKFGTLQGFDVISDAELPGMRLNVEALLDWLDRERPKRFFGYVHTVDVHSPYAPTILPPAKWNSDDPKIQRIAKVLTREAKRWAEFNFDPDYKGKIGGYWTVYKKKRRNLDPLPPDDLNHLISLYDTGIRYTDYWIGQLVEGLKKRGLYDRTILIVTADHGDEFFDHGGVEHGETFYDELMKVPFVMHVPGLAEGRSFEQQVGSIDLMPTILDLLRVPHDELFVQGRTLVPLLRGESFEERPMLGEASIHPGQAAIRTRDWKYIELVDSKELYDLRADPRESSNLCEREKERCTAFAEQLADWRRANSAIAEKLQLPDAPAAQIDEETRERLRALGYQD